MMEEIGSWTNAKRDLTVHKDIWSNHGGWYEIEYFCFTLS
jgi:hypothetical protein